MKTAVLQSNYIPWLGYFHLIQSVDTFVVYDGVQFTKNDWRNRNRLIMNGTPGWITIPVLHQNLKQTIRETRVANPNWASKHWKTISQAYSKAPYFNKYSEIIAETYLQLTTEPSLSEINLTLIRLLCGILNIRTEIIRDEQFDLPDDRMDRLITICDKTNASTHLSGPAAKSYIDVERFEDNGISLEWMNYENYRSYDQNSRDFDPFVSILDLLFCNGPGFHKYIGSK